MFGSNKEEHLLAGLDSRDTIAPQPIESEAPEEDDTDPEVVETMDELRAMSPQELYEEALESIAEGDVEPDAELANMYYSRASAIGSLAALKKMSQ